MKLLVVGGGGREHAIIKKLRENPEVTEIFALPGNGGIAADAVCVPIGARDIGGIVNFAVENRIDYAVVAPDDPLVLGAVDALTERGIPCFGPSKAAAIIEGSKVFSKNLMKKYGIPTAAYESFGQRRGGPCVSGRRPGPHRRESGRAGAGKGRYHRPNPGGSPAGRCLHDGRGHVRPERQPGGHRGISHRPEVSVLSFTDGETLIPMLSSMDHKRALDNDQGLNTGGMGTVAPNPYYTADIAAACMETIFLPTIRAMKAEGRVFKGCLYFGLMLTEQGPKVIEYNCRFGDPETQVVLPLLESDLLTVMRATTEGTLKDTEVKFSGKSACCVVMASKGYPLSYEKGYALHIDKEALPGAFVAGAKLEEGRLLTSGGRVLGLTAVRDSLGEAIEAAYALTGHVHFENAFFRRTSAREQ